ncbi:hypothetical protein SAMN06309944_1515 [Micrococcales bacterium KH10]|nr:hypothetical protein SAMN06309944_1515 [Micrococcales bacterium KH10]
MQRPHHDDEAANSLSVGQVDDEPPHIEHLITAPDDQHPDSPGNQVPRWRIALLITVAALIAATLGWWITLQVSASGTIVPLQVTQATNARAGQLQVGHCLKTLPADGRISTVIVVPCDTSHKAQVIRIETLTDPSENRPRVRHLTEQLKPICEQVPLLQHTADSSITLWLPTQRSWREGDRTAMCLVVAANLTTSLLEEIEPTK